MDRFVDRHIGPDDADIERMLRIVAAPSLPALIDEAVPEAIRASRPLALPPSLTEAEAFDRLAAMASANRMLKSYIGMGYHGTHTPSVLLRNVFENPAWYTAYTPYQAEISQGRLEVLLAFQQMVVDLTGLDVANASLLDEATAAAEAMALAKRVTKSKAASFFVDADTHPQTKAVIATRAAGLGIPLIEGDPFADLDPTEVFAAVLSYPSSTGAVRDLRSVVQTLHGAQALAIAATDLLALTLMEGPGSLGFDVAIGSAQRFGVPMGYGGPHAAFIAAREPFKRALPGRLIGVSVDRRGGPALRMALQTREQHIRRDKATSNICTAQVLLAIMAALYACWHGPAGLEAIAKRVHGLTARLAAGLRSAGVPLAHTAFFDTLAVSVPGHASAVAASAVAAGMNLRVIDNDTVGIALDETTTETDALALARLFGAELGAAATVIPDGLRRRSPFLTHPTFQTHHSETEMMRWLRQLQDKDIALDRAMIPLGSCTMKLNAATEMRPVSLPGFAGLHPFAPRDQATGYRELFADLERWLEEITGFDAVSLQPNAGSQGEYAGLLVIHGYHQARDEGHRDICLIPSSAHGTNPASAVMAGFRVVVVGCYDDGDVDLDDLDAKLAQHEGRVGALMMTYPSTHGVFEPTVKLIADKVHSAGGQVYLDGANLNALVGLARPAEFGADVCHMNLHKTFCIPHGGGGPGMGPIGVKAHLTPFLPNHPVVGEVGGGTSVGAVSAAPWGSPSILPISWAYIAMMGADGLTRATEVAILAANYVAKRLEGHFEVVFRGAGGRVAHECILDVRAIKQATGVGGEDIAKRLIDYGFHAPTMSWPVPETLMVEPTESEPLHELDRFCDAMILIREEIRQIERGEIALDASPLRNAPHTLGDLLAEPWPFAYDRRTAALPGRATDAGKYWPPVARVDNVHGDRHLVCTCPPLEAYQDAAD
ncbi:MAG: aminomethyl-transferring glycine dehydrogenase [Pseudomonadota bacterium]